METKNRIVSVSLLCNASLSQCWFFSSYCANPSNFGIKLHPPPVSNSDEKQFTQSEMSFILPRNSRHHKHIQKKQRFKWDDSLKKIFSDLLDKHIVEGDSTTPTKLCKALKDMIESDELLSQQYCHIVPLLTREVISSHLQKLRKKSPTTSLSITKTSLSITK